MKKISGNKFKFISNSNICFYSTDEIDSISSEQLKYKKYLIFHNSDFSFERKHLKLFNNNNIEKIYSQNVNVLDERVIPIPIGIANPKWEHGNEEILNKVIDMNITKRKGIFFNFQIGTNRKKRQECHDKIKAKGIKWVENKPFEQYLKDLASHKFCISPEGNGIDCHRTWEALYLRTIPICKRSILTEHFSKMFPIVLVDDWNNLPPLRYNDYNWENYDKLDFEYWKKLITH